MNVTVSSAVPPVAALPVGPIVRTVGRTVLRYLWNKAAPDNFFSAGETVKRQLDDAKHYLVDQIKKKLAEQKTAEAKKEPEPPAEPSTEEPAIDMPPMWLRDP